MKTFKDKDDDEHKSMQLVMITVVSDNVNLNFKV